MKRDMDLVRAILFCFEASDKDRLSPKAVKVEGYSDDDTKFHIELMKEAGLLEHTIISPDYGDSRVPRIRFDRGIRPTMIGYDFLDSVRDPEIWRKTKDGASKVGGAGLELLWEMAKAFGKQSIKDRLGLDL